MACYLSRLRLQYGQLRGLHDGGGRKGQAVSTAHERSSRRGRRMRWSERQQCCTAEVLLVRPVWLESRSTWTVSFRSVASCAEVGMAAAMRIGLIDLQNMINSQLTSIARCLWYLNLRFNRAMSVGRREDRGDDV